MVTGTECHFWIDKQIVFIRFHGDMEIGPDNTIVTQYDRLKI